MALTYENLKEHFLVQDLDDRQLAKQIEIIRELYTSRREGLDEKDWTPQEVTAYASFYLPTNLKKFDFIFDQLSSAVREKISNCSVVDFGTGPGTYLLAFLQRLGLSSGKTHYGIDNNKIMIKQAKKLIEGTCPEAYENITFQEKLTFDFSEKESLLIFGNSLNEIHSQDIFQIVEMVSPKYLLLIEPGTPAVFEEVLKLRGYLKDNGYQCLYPCPNMQECPLQFGYERDWCHQVWRGTHELEVERLAQLARIDRRTMPFIGHLYYYGENARKGDALSSARFIRFIGESKHAFNWQVCLEKESSLKIKKFEIPKKILTKVQIKEMRKISVGSNFSYEVSKELSKDQLRLGRIEF